MWWIEGVRSGGRKKGEKCLLGALAVDCGAGLGWSQRQRGGGGKRGWSGAGSWRLCSPLRPPGPAPPQAPGSPFSAVLPRPPERPRTGGLPGHGPYGSAPLGKGTHVHPGPVSRGHPGQAFRPGQSPASPSGCGHARGSHLSVRAWSPGLERTARVTPGKVTSAVPSPSTERRCSWNRKGAGDPPQHALVCPSGLRTPTW